MPQATNITVKNGAGVDKTFTLMTPAAGDGGKALWALKEGAYSAIFPILDASARPGADGKRRLNITFKFPSTYTDTATGLTMLSVFAGANVQVILPDTFPENQKDDFVSYLTNLLSSPMLKSLIRDALPAT